MVNKKSMEPVLETEFSYSVIIWDKIEKISVYNSETCSSTLVVSHIDLVRCFAEMSGILHDRYFLLSVMHCRDPQNNN